MPNNLISLMGMQSVNFAYVSWLILNHIKTGWAKYAVKNVFYGGTDAIGLMLYMIKIRFTCKL